MTRKVKLPNQHQTALRKEIERLEKASPVGWRTLNGYVPELDELREALVGLLELADPRRGRTLDSSRGNHDPISEDGRSTIEGRGTLPDRERIAYFRRQIKRLAREIEEAPTKGSRLPRKRCKSKSCPQPGRFQSPMHKFCGYCGETMEEAA